jgi:Biotin/lipoate A/B protein ligase family
MAIAATDLRREPSMPPGFTLVGLREAGDAFAHAVRIAPEAGAATLVWVRRFDLVEFALVLEPDAPLITARLAHYMCMNALADALSIHCPPERPILFGWPDALLYDHGLIGGGRIAWPKDCAETDVPEWVVFGAMVRASRPSPFEDAPTLTGVAMDEGGFEEVGAADLVESFARHIMLNASRWQSDGPKATVRRWLDRTDKKPGFRQGIEPNGDQITTSQAGEERRNFIAALADAAWYDAEEGGPKL